jgi:hypothetical protein
MAFISGAKIMNMCVCKFVLEEYLDKLFMIEVLKGKVLDK